MILRDDKNYIDQKTLQHSTLFCYLLYEYSKRFVQLVVQPFVQLVVQLCHL